MSFYSNICEISDTFKGAVVIPSNIKDTLTVTVPNQGLEIDIH